MINSKINVIYFFFIIKNNIFKHNFIKIKIIFFLNYSLTHGDWGLGIGDWVQGLMNKLM